MSPGKLPGRQWTLVRMADLEDQSQIPDPRMKAAQREFVEDVKGPPVSWIVGTSLAFEMLVLSLAALVFCRRDF